MALAEALSRRSDSALNLALKWSLARLAQTCKRAGDMPLRVVLPVLQQLAAPTAPIVVLVKPQFEAAKGSVSRGGVVRDPGVWARVLDDVVETAQTLGLGARAAMASPLRGPAGNVEFLMQLGPGRADGADLAAAVAEGVATRS